MNAISDFENDQRKHNQKIQDLRVADALQSGKQVEGTTTLPVSEIFLYKTTLN